MAGPIVPNLLRAQQEEPEEDASSYFDKKAKKERLKKHRASKAGQQKKRVHQKKPKAHERKVAKALGGQRRGGSGSLHQAKGDGIRRAVGLMTNFPLLIENKRVEGKKSIGVKAEWLAKISAEAHAEGAHPALAIQFDEQVMQSLQRYGIRAETDWVALPLSTLKALFERLDEDVEL